MQNNYRITAIAIVTTFLLLLFSSPAMMAQSSGEGASDFEEFRQQFKKDYFSVGALLQTVGDYQPERFSGTNGFRVGNARMKIYGEFDEGFGYLLQTNFTSSTSILDATTYYRFSPGFQVQAGLFKTPFSYEFLTGAPALDVIGRSTVVNQLTPNRQVGAQISGRTNDGILSYKAGVFNGNRFGANRNNDNQLLYVGRLEANFETDASTTGNKITFGMNASYEDKKQENATGNLIDRFRGKQTLLGSDVHITQGELMLKGELIYSWLESITGDEFNPFGYHATVGYHATPDFQLLARWDYFDGDVLANNARNVVAAINVFPSDISKIQVNYIIPTEESLDYSRFLVNFQVAL